MLFCASFTLRGTGYEKHEGYLLLHRVCYCYHFGRVRYSMHFTLGVPMISQAFLTAVQLPRGGVGFEVSNHTGVSKLPAPGDRYRLDYGIAHDEVFTKVTQI